MLPVQPKAKYRINFCDLKWKEDEKKGEFLSLVQGKMFVKSKPLDFYLKIIFRNQIEWKKTESTLSNFSVKLF